MSVFYNCCQLSLFVLCLAHAHQKRIRAESIYCISDDCNANINKISTVSLQISPLLMIIYNMYGKELQGPFTLSALIQQNRKRAKHTVLTHKMGQVYPPLCYISCYSILQIPGVKGPRMRIYFPAPAAALGASPIRGEYTRKRARKELPVRWRRVCPRGGH